MIVVRLMGGLGNQMFQYACGRAAAARVGEELRLDTRLLEKRGRNNFITPRTFELGAFRLEGGLHRGERTRISISEALGRAIRCDLFYRRFIERSAYAFDGLPPKHRRLVLAGYFQSFKYFTDAVDVIRKEFQFAAPTGKYARHLAYIKSVADSVAVLVRRDDYISLGQEYLLQPEYYESAFRLMRQRLAKPRFLIFTIGETNWAKSQFAQYDDVEIVENDRAGLHGFEKMHLMSECAHMITANSSFGWWSAWLNQNPRKIVVAPRKWVKEPAANAAIAEHRIPFNWISV